VVCKGARALDAQDAPRLERRGLSQAS